MIVINEKMIPIYRSLDWGKQKLDKKLHHLTSKGFTHINNCYFLKQLYEMQKSANLEDFVDKTGYECFVNSIHIDDYLKSDFIIQGYLFLDKVFKLWNQLGNSHRLKGYLSQTEYGANVKFHVLRENENWIQQQDVDKFEEPILISEMTLIERKKK